MLLKTVIFLKGFLTYKPDPSCLCDQMFLFYFIWILQAESQLKTVTLSSWRKEYIMHPFEKKKKIFSDISKLICIQYPKCCIQNVVVQRLGSKIV